MALSDQLKHKIDSFQPSQAAEDLVSQTKLLLIAGPTGSGKSSVIKKLLNLGNYQYMVSHTTRQPRPGEVNGENYYFVDEATIGSMLDEGQLVEVEAVYNEHASGMSVAAIKDAKDSGKIAVTDIDVTGAKAYMKLNPDLKAVFILPPSYDEWVDRLSKRGGGVSQETIRSRLRNAQSWLEQALTDGYWHFTINNNLDKAVADIDSYANSSTAEHSGGDDALLEHAWHVLGELKRQLNS